MRIARLIPALAIMGTVGAVTAADDFDLQFHGFASQGYLVTRNNAWYSPESEDHGTLEFNEFAVNVVATPIDRLRVGVQIFAQDFGESGNNKPQIDWAYGSYSFPTIGGVLDLGFSAGRVKAGHGLYNEYRDLDMTRTSVFLPSTVYNNRFRDLYLAMNGVSLDARLGAGPLGSFEMEAYIGHVSIDKDEGPLYNIFTDLGVGAITRLSYEQVRGGNITWHPPIDGLRVRYSLRDAVGLRVQGTMVAGGTLQFPAGSTYHHKTPNVWDNIFSVEYQRDRWTVAAEYSYFYFKADVVVDVDTNGPAPGGLGVNFVRYNSYRVADSAYISASYRLPILDDKLEVQGAWLWMKEDMVRVAAAYTIGWTAAVRYDVTDNWLIKAEYGWYDGTAGNVRRNEQYDRTIEPVWGYLALKTTIDF